MKRRVVGLKLKASPDWWKGISRRSMKRTLEHIGRYKETYTGTPVTELEYVST